MAGSTVGREIERKFLVKDMSWKNEGTGVLYRQGYLSLDPDRVVRIRVAGDKARLTIKSRVSDLVRREFEYPIPVADAEEILKELCQGYRITKTRYLVKYAGHVWEIDEFEEENSGLIVAEVELSAVYEVIELPPWAGKEVTDDARYLNIRLCQLPFSRWNKE